MSRAGDLGPTTGSGALEPYDLRCESLHEPLGLEVLRPRLSWRARSSRRGDEVSRYGIAVWRVDPDGREDQVWSPEPAPTPDQPIIRYEGPELQPMTRYRWQVRLWDRDGAEAGTATSWFETGIAGDDGWWASWIGRDLTELPDLDPPTDTYATLKTRSLAPCPLLRRSFRLDQGVRRARLYATARGVFRCSLNGRRAGDDELAPGWQDYRHRITYQTYDVTDLLRDGENVLGAILGEGWWSGFFGFDPRRAGKLYGDTPSFLAQLVIDLEDGTQLQLGTDDRWVESPGRIRYADLLMGEAHDAREDRPGWDAPGFDAADWRPVTVTERDGVALEGMRAEPVRVVEELRPDSIMRLDEGQTLIDFGQNLVGRIRLTVRGATEGHQVELLHAEMLEDGDLYLANLRSAEARDVLICSGAPTETFAPLFTFHGFRYAKVIGYPGELADTDVVAEVLQSDMPWSGSFTSSDPLVDQLQANIRWGQRGNLVSVPTDCPQRDERLGWLADAQVFLPTACRNADVGAFFANWMHDVVTGQDDDGAFPDVAPQESLITPGAPAWGDGGVIVPWELYRTYGDIEVLRSSYAAMRRWVDHITAANPELVWTRRTGRAYGDWLQIGVVTPREVLATAYFARSTDLTARAAALLGEDTDADELRRRFAAIRARFIDEFVDEDGRVRGDTQTCYLLALAFDLLPAELRGRAVEHLVERIVERDDHLTTGFVGVSMLCQVLSAEGRSDIAYRLLHQDTFPSWLFSVLQGATTIWERWDGWTPDAGFQSANMNSFNHYSLGAVGDWLFGSVAGIGQSPTSAGYRELVLAPQVGGRLTHAEATQETVRGRVASAWRIENGTLRWEVQVPPGPSAKVVVPTSDPAKVLESGAPVAEAEQVTIVAEDGPLVCEIGSGHYVFEAPWSPAA